MNEGFEIKKRNDDIDIAKGIAILMVILGHCAGLSKYLINFVFSFHMPLFFCASGYFFKAGKSKEIAVKKAKQLLIPYLITGGAVLVLSALKIVIQGASGREICLKVMDKIWAMFYGSGMSYHEPFRIKSAEALWFFLALFFAFLIVNECLKLKYPFIGIGIIAFCGYYTSQMIWLPLSIQAGMTSALYVYLGYMANKYHILEILKQKAVAIELMVLYLIYLFVLQGGKLYLVRNYFGLGILEIAGSVTGVLCVTRVSQIIAEKAKFLRKLFSYIGKNTLYILCIHIIDLSIIDWSPIYNLPISKGKCCGIVLVYILRCLLAIGGMIVIQKIISWRKNKVMSQSFNTAVVEITRKGKRDISIDMARGLAIILMIYSHGPIDEKLRTIIFSFHMPIFILLSGYFYKREESINIKLKKIMKGLVLPYLGAAMSYAVISTWKFAYTSAEVISKQQIVDYLLKKLSYIPWGMSYASTKFQNIESVGPIWFILCLISCKLIYTLLEKVFVTEKKVTIAVVATAILGYFIGKRIAFLPWSVDVAMVSLVFFHTGYFLRKKDFFSKKCDIAILLLLVIIWIIDIQCGGLELSIRDYGYFVIGIVGAVAGSILIIEFGRWLTKYEFLKTFLSFFGKHSMLLLCIHCVEIRVLHWSEIIPEADSIERFLLRMIMIFSFLIIMLSFKEMIKNRKINTV